MKTTSGFARVTLMVWLVCLMQLSAQAVITKIHHHIAISGSQVLVPVYVWDFDSIGSFNLTIEYDASSLQFEEIHFKHPQLSAAAIINIAGSPAKIRIASYNLNCISLPDSSIMATFRFTLIGQYSALSWPNGPGQNEYGHCVPDTIPSQFIPGSVSSPSLQISGQLVYDNALASPLPAIPVLLSSSSGFSQTLLTDPGGMFSLGMLTPGTYTITPQPLGIPAGINAADAMLTLMQFVNPGMLSGMALKAADVDASGYVNALDALLIAKYFTGMITSFPAGAWVTEPLTLSLNGPVQPVLLKMRFYGDVDGSFVP